jgi:hypothetical protein
MTNVNEPVPSQVGARGTVATLTAVWHRKSTIIAAIAIAAIVVYLILRFAAHTDPGA